MSEQSFKIVGQDKAKELPQPSVHADKDFAGNVAMVTLGCAKNLVDSEVMLGALRGRGFRVIAEPQDADLIVVNTCAFLQSAVEEGIERILELSHYKTSGRCRRLVVAGCMVERYKGELEQSLPEVDQFLSTDELLEVGKESKTTETCFEEARRPYFLYDESMPRVVSTAQHSTYLKIAEGCNRPCTFCIIPKLRGGFRSRSRESITEEAQGFLQNGVRELNLVAQDLTAYGSDFPGNRGIKSELPSLLRSISTLAPAEMQYWIRLLYAYPIGVNEELLRTIVESPNICNYLDIPLQHSSGAVLKRMQRPLGEKGTRSLVEHMRATSPEIAIRSTFIVGFPGETEEDVDSLENFIAEGHFANVGVFTYSQEEEAKSFSFDAQVDESVKVERRERIMEAQQVVVQRMLEAKVGTRELVLIDGTHEDTDLLLSARAEWQAPETDGVVIINDIDVEENADSAEGFSSLDLAGRFCTVEYKEVAGYDLVATIVSI